MLNKDSEKGNLESNKDAWEHFQQIRMMRNSGNQIIMFINVGQRIYLFN